MSGRLGGRPWGSRTGVRRRRDGGSGRREGGRSRRNARPSANGSAHDAASLRAVRTSQTKRSRPPSTRRTVRRRRARRSARTAVRISATRSVRCRGSARSADTGVRQYSTYRRATALPADPPTDECSRHDPDHREQHEPEQRAGDDGIDPAHTAEDEHTVRDDDVPAAAAIDASTSSAARSPSPALTRVTSGARFGSRKRPGGAGRSAAIAGPVAPLVASAVSPVSNGGEVRDAPPMRPP